MVADAERPLPGGRWSSTVGSGTRFEVEALRRKCGITGLAAWQPELEEQDPATAAGHIFQQGRRVAGRLVAEYEGDPPARHTFQLIVIIR